MTTTKVKSGGAWRSLSEMRFPLVDGFGDPYWHNPQKVYVNRGGAWLDLGYVPTASPPGTPYFVSGTPTSVTVGVRMATQQPAPSLYTITLYTRAGVRKASATRTATELMQRTLVRGPDGNFLNPSHVTFGGGVPYRTTLFPPATAFNLVPDTDYYVVVVGSGDDMLPSTSAALRIRTGHNAEYTYTPIYDWKASTTPIHPVAGTATSSLSGYPLSYSVDKGLAGSSGPLAPFTSGWTSKARSAQRSTVKPNDLWEGVDYTMPSGPRRRLSKVQVVADQTQNFYLGVKVGNDWKGTLTAALLGIGAYPTLLEHDYLLSNTDHTNNVKVFDVLRYNWEFTEVQKLSLAINNFVNLYGTPATSGTYTPGTSTQVTIPAGYVMKTNSTRKKVYLARLYASPTATATTYLYFSDPDTGVRYEVSPTPPAGAVWPNGATSGNWDIDVSGNVLHFRPLTAGGALDGYTDGCTYLRIGSTLGPVIAKSVSSVFTNAVLGTTTTSGPTYVAGSPSVPAWRARILDVSLFYEDWADTGKTEKSLTRAAAATVAGPTVWA